MGNIIELPDRPVVIHINMSMESTCCILEEVRLSLGAFDLCFGELHLR